MPCCTVTSADGRTLTFPVAPGAGDPACAHAARLEGVCLACGHCEHDIILNGACLYCGSDAVDGVARSPRQDLIPADRLKRH
jgi:hypothetical protein